jgi:outer membrane lipoprotein-sorting protein
MKTTRSLLIVLLFIFCLLLSGVHLKSVDARTTNAEDVLERSRAKYAALKTYSDTGTVTTEYLGPGDSGSPLVERHTFNTFYRAPRQFFFEFAMDPKVGEERVVVWSDGTDFNSWWSATKVHDTYPKGQGANAFALAAFPSKNSITQISPLLFAQAGLHGPLTDLKVLRSDQTENVNGHRCYKVVGEVGLSYGTGAVTNLRPTTVWIDAESLLVRKILEDTPKNASGTDRTTTEFEPKADPQIEDSHFKFTPPK